VTIDQPPSASQARVPPRPETSVLDVATALLRHWRLVLGFPFVTALAAAGVSLLMAPSFTATVAFFPEAGSAQRLPAGLAGLVGQLGISVDGGAMQSPRFYADVLKSRALLERVVESRYPNPAASTDSVRLLDVLNIHGRNAPDSLSNGVQALRTRITTQVDVQTGVVRLNARFPDPVLAAAVANHLIDYLNDFNTQTRQSQARERRKFVEQRAAAAEVELGSAEEDLRKFYERNRTWQQAPQLTFEEGRLRRQVDLRQEVYLTLRREYETARIQEVNDAPVITVIEPAVPPQQRSRPRRTVMVSLAFLLGGMLGVFAAFGSEYLARVRREDADRYADFRAVLTRLREDLGRGLLPRRSHRRS
jgi:uncharacterized protein involved in exopolysaccharide biosynthesis